MPFFIPVSEEISLSFEFLEDIFIYIVKIHSP